MGFSKRVRRISDCWVETRHKNAWGWEGAGGGCFFSVKRKENEEDVVLGGSGAVLLMWTGVWSVVDGLLERRKKGKKKPSLTKG